MGPWKMGAEAQRWAPWKMGAEAQRWAPDLNEAQGDGGGTCLREDGGPETEELNWELGEQGMGQRGAPATSKERLGARGRAPSGAELGLCPAGLYTAVA